VKNIITMVKAVAMKPKTLMEFIKLAVHFKPNFRQVKLFKRKSLGW